MNIVSKALLILLGVSFLGVFAAAIIIITAFWHFGRGLPDYQQLDGYEPPTVTRVHAGDGQLLTEFAREKRIFVPYRSIPKIVVKAFVSAEDKNFYSHPGIDLAGVIRAIITNIRYIGSNRRPVGASTITQQVAKNFLLTNEVSMDRKIKEAILAFRIEHVLSKERILELYLNEIYLGQGSYGVAAAALNYFDKALNELTLDEAAFIAGLPKAPNNYHPTRQPQAAIARRSYVIGRMLEDGYITKAQALQALRQSLVVRSRSETRVAEADFFVEEVRRELYETFGESKLYGGGLSVRTTLIPRLQKISDRVLRDGLIAYDRRHGWRGPIAKLKTASGWANQLSKLSKPKALSDAASDWSMAVVLQTTKFEARIGFSDGTLGRIGLSQLKWARKYLTENIRGPRVMTPADVLQPLDVVLVSPLSSRKKKSKRNIGYWVLQQLPEINGALVALDPHTGRILAMSGGFSYSGSQYNRATQAKRQPGSAFKPLVYLAAMDHGFNPSSIVHDAPFVVDQGPGLKRWKPANYTKKFYGPSPLRLGIEKSRNLMTVRLAQNMGIDVVADYAERLGIVTELPRLLSMSLGAAETTLLNITTGYAMLVNGGRQIQPTLIDRIQDRRGKTIFRHEKRFCSGCKIEKWNMQLPPIIPDNRKQLVDPQSAYQVVSMLEGVVQRGTGLRIKALGKPLAGKTGTTNDSVDTWFIGFSPDLAVGVFIGFDTPRSLGKKETGSSVAVPVFRDFMREVLKDTQPIPFRVPPGIKLVRVNSKTGQRANSSGSGTILEAFKAWQNPPESKQYMDVSKPSSKMAPSGEGVGGIKGLY
ncbi:MAG: penicillin-binding protein [Rhodospirillaceae bacterium]|nr:penicillin-binding protein [Rhodospirillaceae bacterium]|tara:strand:- start:1676 stop:4126 length:2451 start_codon:yes stop_codon:yes gene_type:complete